MSPTPLERIRELSIYEGDERLTELESFTYRWVSGPDGSGFEALDIKNRGGGGCHYSGVYHPGDGCCRGNPCRYCGRAVVD